MITINQESENNPDEKKIFSNYYSIAPPFGNSGIHENKSMGRMEYLMLEPYLDQDELLTLSELKTLIIENKKIPFEILKDEGRTSDFIRELIDTECKRRKRQARPGTRSAITFAGISHAMGPLDC